ncbi:MAG: hypothetical protein KY455_08530 [Euryarchaeota archaeon]|nr:hypothetical protein [Euryarchaeota archaeon]
MAEQLHGGCQQTGFPGYIVITCAGSHVHGVDVASGAIDVLDSHTHHVTEGTVTGDFCGGPPTAKKAYLVG